MVIVWRLRGNIIRTALLDCVTQCSVRNTPMWAVLTGHWVHFTVLRCRCVFVFSCISLHACCIIVTRWGGPGGIEAWSDDWPSSFSASILLVGSHDLLKYRPRMTYTVSSGTLNPTQLNWPTGSITIYHLRHFRTTFNQWHKVIDRRICSWCYCCWPHYLQRSMTPTKTMTKD